MRWSRESLLESDPRRLGLDSLSALRKALITKLLIASREQRARHRNTIEVGGANLRSDSIEMLLARVAHLDRFNAVLQEELECLMDIQTQEFANCPPALTPDARKEGVLRINGGRDRD